MVASKQRKSTEQLHVVNARTRKRSPSNCCCCSLILANVILLLAVIVALTICVIFLNDEPLYEYGEQLLSLRFYRYIVFVTVVVPLALFVPIYSGLSAFWKRKSLDKNKENIVFVSTTTTSNKLTVFRIIYGAIVALLILIGLVLIFPNARFSGLTGQLSNELRKHMTLRYQNDVSYKFIDAIQREYQCCDLMFYRASPLGKIPLSCYQQNGYYSTVYEEDCVETLASLVSTRCGILSIALAVILLMLIVLIGVDIVSVATNTDSATHTYDVGAKEAKYLQAKSGVNDSNNVKHFDDDDDDDDDEDNDNDNAVIVPSDSNNKQFVLDLEQQRQRQARATNSTTSTHNRCSSPRPPSMQKSVAEQTIPHSILKTSDSLSGSRNGSFNAQKQRFSRDDVLDRNAPTTTTATRSPQHQQQQQQQSARANYFANTTNEADNYSLDNDYDDDYYYKDNDVYDDDIADVDFLNRAMSRSGAENAINSRKPIVGYSSGEPMLTTAQLYDTQRPKSQTPTRLLSTSLLKSSTTTEVFEESRSNTHTSIERQAAASERQSPLCGLWTMQRPTTTTTTSNTATAASSSSTSRVKFLDSQQPTTSQAIDSQDSSGAKSTTLPRKATTSPHTYQPKPYVPPRSPLGMR